MEFNEVLNMYDENTPKLLLFDAQKTDDQQKQIEQLSKLNVCLKANPLDIVLESWLNVLSERISIKKVTFSNDKMLVNTKVNDEAVEEIKTMIGNDASRLKTFHDLWLKKFASALRTNATCDPKMTIDQAVMQLGKQFRISTNSALRAIVSISK
jgi:hypothetical protein